MGLGVLLVLGGMVGLIIGARVLPALSVWGNYDVDELIPRFIMGSLLVVLLGAGIMLAAPSGSSE
jgi:hypothetical protein